MFQDLGTSSLSSATTAIIASGLLGVIILLLFFGPSSRRRQKKKRTFSYTSAAMAMGGFPEKTNYPDPVINVAFYYDNKACPTVKDLTTLVVPKFLKFERYSTIPLPHEGSTRPCGAGGAGIIPSDYDKFVRVFEVKDDDEVLKTIEDHLHDPLSRGGRSADLPWWELLLIKNTGRNGQSAVIWRAHHSLGDGLSMLCVAETVIEYVDGTPIKSMRDEFTSKKQKHEQSHQRMSWYTISVKALSAFFEILAVPNSRYDDDTYFSPGEKRKLNHSQNRKLILFPTVPLNFVKELKNTAKCTINDVLYTCFSQAIHDYLQDKDDTTLQEKGESLLCRTLIPVVMPRSAKIVRNPAEALRNTFAFISADLCIGYNNIMDRLYHVHDTMMRIKRSLLLPVGLFIQNKFLSYVPHFINQQVVLDLFQRHSCVFSNVPGPSKPCIFAGKEVIRVGMYYSNLMPQTGFLSYRGEIFGCICLDPNRVPDDCRTALPIWYARAFVELANQLDVQPIPKELEEFAERKC